jgi:hypothetical protein
MDASTAPRRTAASPPPQILRRLFRRRLQPFVQNCQLPRRDLYVEQHAHSQTGTDVPHSPVNFETIVSLCQLNADCGSREKGMASVDEATGPAKVGGPRTVFGSRGEFENFRPKNERIAGSNTSISHFIWHRQISFAGVAHRSYCSARRNLGIVKTSSEEVLTGGGMALAPIVLLGQESKQVGRVACRLIQ